MSGLRSRQMGKFIFVIISQQSTPLISLEGGVTSIVFVIPYGFRINFCDCNGPYAIASKRMHMSSIARARINSH